jgi:SAM-dependent methyltransferase
MVYASRSPQADYINRSKYAVPSSIGSGETDYERIRFREFVQIISRFVTDPQAAILDVGCARGGLLTALRDARYEFAEGIDPSSACVSACRAKELRAAQGTIESLTGKWDCIILSHVLEHLWDVSAALKQLADCLTLNGILYLETPNALKYQARVPFMDINREHINHFSLVHLCLALERAGLSLEASASRDDLYHFGLPLPAIYVIGKKTNNNLVASIEDYLKDSAKELHRIEVELFEKFAPYNACIVWGSGEFSQTLLRLPLFQKISIVQVVDRDPGKSRDQVLGLTVGSPEKIRNHSGDLPILIASMVNAESIEKDIRVMGLKNPVIRIGHGI